MQSELFGHDSFVIVVVNLLKFLYVCFTHLWIAWIHSNCVDILPIIQIWNFLFCTLSIAIYSSNINDNHFSFLYIRAARTHIHIYRTKIIITNVKFGAHFIRQLIRFSTMELFIKNNERERKNRTIAHDSEACLCVCVFLRFYVFFFILFTAWLFTQNSRSSFDFYGDVNTHTATVTPWIYCTMYHFDGLRKLPITTSTATKFQL